MTISYCPAPDTVSPDLQQLHVLKSSQKCFMMSASHLTHGCLKVFYTWTRYILHKPVWEFVSVSKFVKTHLQKSRLFLVLLHPVTLKI